TSISSCSLAPAFRASCRWMSMHKGHCVVRATPIAMSSLYFFGIAPSSSATLSQARNAAIAFGPRSAILGILPRLSFEYIFFMLLFHAVFDDQSQSLVIDVEQIPVDVYPLGRALRFPKETHVPFQRRSIVRIAMFSRG